LKVGQREGLGTHIWVAAVGGDAPRLLAEPTRGRAGPATLALIS
jgi:hypothetical protein